ncbi:MAG: hypothetical protein LBQ90_11210 [Synergistaceae bacterium]|nr:hypothetical protein [Synergistaceae bacterium]
MPQSRKILLDSKTPWAMSGGLRVFMLFFGLLLAGGHFYDTLRRALPFRDAFPKLIVGAACVYGSLFRKKIYLAPEGIVRETQTPLARNREILPWSEVRHVTLAFRKKDMLVLFEKGTMGWKVLCEREQEQVLRKILGQRLPGVEIDVL